jgi:hypothetical protein
VPTFSNNNKSQCERAKRQSRQSRHFFVRFQFFLLSYHTASSFGWYKGWLEFSTNASTNKQHDIHQSGRSNIDVTEKPHFCCCCCRRGEDRLLQGLCVEVVVLTKKRENVLSLPFAHILFIHDQKSSSTTTYLYTVQQPVSWGKETSVKNDEQLVSMRTLRRPRSLTTCCLNDTYV